MNLYLISQDVYTGYDTYDSAVVAADTEEEARLIHPAGDYDFGWPSDRSVVNVRLIGIAQPDVERGVVCASFNAG